MKGRHRLFAFFMALGLLWVAGNIYRPSSAVLPSGVSAQTASIQKISGFAWSSNIGWVGFGANQLNSNWSGVELMPADPGDNNSRRLRGFAWSPNIGWINFDPSASGAPDESNNGQAKVAPRLTSAGNLVGWARACSVFLSGCSGLMLGASERGDWDGWISLRGGATSGGVYGVNLSANQFQGQAWGADVVGWLDFCDTAANGKYCVNLNQLNVECQGAVTDDDVDWTAFVSGGSGSLSYEWSGAASGSGSTEQSLDLSPGTHTAIVKVNDQSGAFGEAGCSATVSPSGTSPVTLLVSVVGNGQVAYDGHTCPNPSPDCSITVPFGTTITDFTATPAAGGSFSGWGGAASACLANPNNCSVTANADPTLVIARFSGVGGGSPSDGVADDQPIEIIRHDLGFPAFSSRRLIDNSTTESVEICLFGIENASGQTLDSVLDGDGKSAAKCYFGKGPLAGGGATSCSDQSLRVTLSPLAVPGNGVTPGDSQALFFIEIPEKSLAAREASPYTVTLGYIDSEGACIAESGSGWQFPFRYQPFGFVPE